MVEKNLCLKKWQFKEIGISTEIFEPISIIQLDKIILKNHIRISEFSLLAGGLGLYIGNFVHIASQVIISGGGYCFLEDFVGVCAGVKVITGSDNIDGEGIPSPLVPQEFRSFYRSLVYCERHSFLGTGCIIHPGVTIGEGAVVGSGSVVTKSLDPWGIYTGSPARRIKERPREKILDLAQKTYDAMQIFPVHFKSEVAKAIKNLDSGSKLVDKTKR